MEGVGDFVCFFILERGFGFEKYVGGRDFFLGLSVKEGYIFVRVEVENK